MQLLRERYRTRPRHGPYYAVLPPPPPPPEPGSEPVTEPPNDAVGGSASSGWLPSCVEEMCDRAVQALAGEDLVSRQAGRPPPRSPQMAPNPLTAVCTVGHLLSKPWPTAHTG